MSQSPLLRRGPLSDTIWCITNYVRSVDGSLIMVREKHDVTDQFDALVAEFAALQTQESRDTTTEGET